MAIEFPTWMQNNPYSARLDRGLIDAIFPTEGVIQGMAVSQRAAGANISVDINGPSGLGRSVIQGDDQTNQGKYLITETAVYNLIGFSAAPSAGQERYDVVYQRVNDPNAGGPAGNGGSYGIQTGTAAAVGSAVRPTVPTSAIALAEVRWTSGLGAITNAMITSRRTPAVAYGGDPIGSVMEFAAPESQLDARYIVADGRAISRTTYATYFNMVGTAYGPGDGSSTFNVIDKRGRVGVGADNMGGTAANRVAGVVVGSTGGSASKALSLAEMPAHSHVVNNHSHGGNTNGQNANHYHDMSNHQHWSGGQTDVAADHGHPSPFNYFRTGFGGNLDLFDGGAGVGYDVGQIDVSGSHSHPWSAWSSVPNINTTGWTSNDHIHGINGEAPGTSSVGSGSSFSIMNPYVGVIYAVRVI